MKEVALPKGQKGASVWLSRFAVLTATVTVGLIAAGALVTSTGSGDAIPDWPTSYGALIPSYLAGGVLIEWSHRVIAGLTGLFIFALALWLSFSDKPRFVKGLGWLSALAVVAQAILGGLRVLVVSDEIVQAKALALTGAPHTEAVRVGFAIAHATLAQIVLGLTFAIATFTSPFQTYLPSPTRLSRERLLIFALIALLFVQLLLGAVMRHLGAGLVIPDFPTSFGRLIPPFGNLPFDPANPERLTYQAFAFRVAIHFAHRANGFLIALLIIALFVAVRQTAWGFPPLRRLVKGLLGLVFVQIFLGGFTIWTKLAVPVTVLHVAVGATLLGLTVVGLALLKGREGIYPFPPACSRSGDRVPVASKGREGR